MKNIIYFLFLTMAISSCQSNKNEFTKQKDFTFLTDSLNIDQQLENHKLAGFSLVVFENYDVVYSNQFGRKSINSDEKIDENTAFSTASIAKPITALLCFILEEKGLIDLDKPVDNYLKRWNLPKSQFTENSNPTWKNFLNHTAGSSQHGFADFYEGDTIPTLKESLLGNIPRYEKEIEFLFAPGTNWQYSGGGYCIIQMALEDTLSKSIAELAEEHIFLPLGLKNTTMVQPNEKGFLTNVALVHDKDGKVIKTGLPITPQVAASGLWSTPQGLAIIAVEIQNALRNRNNKVISNYVAKQLTKTTTLKNSVGGWSYGWQKSFGTNNIDWFAGGGSNTGVGGWIYATMKDGNGFVYLANGEKPNRFPVNAFVRNKLYKLFDWGEKINPSEAQEISEEMRKRLKGNYNDFLYGQGMPVSIIERESRIYVESPFFKHFSGRKDSEMIYLKNGLFKIIDYPNFLKFNMKDGKPNSVIITRDNLNIKIELNDSEK